MLRPRYAVPAVFILLGVVAVGKVVETPHPTSKATWIGLASTLITAGLVDASGLLDTAARERAVLQITLDRLHKAIWRLTSILTMVFKLEGEEATITGMKQTLAGTTMASVDLSEEVEVFPQKLEKRELVLKARDRMAEYLDAAIELGAATSQARRFHRLYSASEENGFMLYLRDVAPIKVLARIEPDDALQLLDDLQSEVEWLTKRLG